jgi:hypothetical protein
MHFILFYSVPEVLSVFDLTIFMPMFYPHHNSVPRITPVPVISGYVAA